MTDIQYYGIAELDSNGWPVKYLPPLGVGQTPGTLYYLTSDLAGAWPIADRATAEEYADVLAANNPGRNLGVIELPPGTQPVAPPAPSL
jgi:hypothetical protein